MGADIHLWAEKKTDGKWVSADKWVKNKYHTEPGDGEPEFTVAYEDRFYSGRNYSLFAILADVRNGYGFAGIPTGKGFKPIAVPKGIPQDASPEYLHEVKRWGRDGHSHTYFTVQELLDYDWNQVSTLYGVVSLLQYKEWRDAGGKEGPGEYSGAISGQDIKTVSPEQADEILKRHKVEAPALAGGKERRFADEPKIDGVVYYVHIQWTETYAACAENFLKVTLPKLQAVGKPDEVRIVCFFDN